jgi:hypothetical protein
LEPRVCSRIHGSRARTVRLGASHKVCRPPAKCIKHPYPITYIYDIERTGHLSETFVKVSLAEELEVVVVEDCIHGPLWGGFPLSHWKGHFVIVH